MQSEIEFIGWEQGLELMGMHPEIESIGWEQGLELMGMQSEIEFIGIEPELKSPDPRINTRFGASPKAFIFYGLLKTRRPY